MFQCQSVASDLKLIEGPGKAGILVLNSNITKCKNICVINQSPTGIYEKVIDLAEIMSWRIVVISKRAKLDYQLGYMVVRNEEVTKIHLGEISTVLIESTAVSITTSLLAELTKKED